MTLKEHISGDFHSRPVVWNVPVLCSNFFDFPPLRDLFMQVLIFCQLDVMYLPVVPAVGVPCIGSFPVATQPRRVSTAQGAPGGPSLAHLQRAYNVYDDYLI